MDVSFDRVQIWSNWRCHLIRLPANGIVYRSLFFPKSIVRWFFLAAKKSAVTDVERCFDEARELVSNFENFVVKFMATWLIITRWIDEVVYFLYCNRNCFRLYLSNWRESEFWHFFCNCVWTLFMSGNIRILKQILPTENTFSTVGHISIAMFYLSEDKFFFIIYVEEVGRGKNMLKRSKFY